VIEAIALGIEYHISVMTTIRPFDVFDLFRFNNV
uniref:N-acetyltransferase domain-containing protein n=1 Tax=Parascaris univalens TaxID=6257 RepID=A0A915AHC9_PARUN